MNTQVKQAVNNFEADRKKCEDYIVKAIKQNGEFSHNICSLALRGFATKHGYKAANALVKEYKLTKLFGIPQVKGQP